MQKLDYSRMNWRRIAPASLVGLTVTVADVTGVPSLCNGIVLHTASAVYSIETDGVGLEVYRSISGDSKEVNER